MSIFGLNYLLFFTNNQKFCPFGPKVKIQGSETTFWMMASPSYILENANLFPKCPSSVVSGNRNVLV